MQEKFILQTYNRFDFEPVRAEDFLYLCDSNGSRYLDFAGGIAVNVLGYNNSSVERAIIAQLHNGFLAQSNYFHNKYASQLAAKLTALSGLDKVFFCNSGAEACESAIKIARKRHNIRRNSVNAEIICMSGAFHGRTMATISAGNRPAYTVGFEPLLPGFRTAEFNNLESVKASINKDTCGIMLEIIQGENGVNEGSAAFLNGVEQLCRDNDIALILDEVQTGMGRTGTFFCFEHYNLRPDIVTLAKGIANGIPMGCCIVNNEFASHMAPGSHGSTFGGNALAARVSLAVIDEIESRGLLRNAMEMGDLLKNCLFDLQKKFPDKIKSISGLGLMIGIQLSETLKNRDIAEIMLKNGLLVTLASNNVIRLLPPIIINETHIREALEIMEATLVQSDILAK